MSLLNAKTSGENMSIAAPLATTLSPEEKKRYALSYSKFVLPIARKVASRLPGHLSVEDLIQEGVAGLLEALDRFDPSQGIDLKTFASRRIRGAIIDALRRDDLASRGVRQRARTLAETENMLQHRLHREPSRDEVAAEMGWSREELSRRSNEVTRASVTSIFSVAAKNQGREKMLLETLRTGQDTAEEAERNLAVSSMRKALGGLKPREQLLLSLYYQEGLTTREIGDILGVSEARISQIHRRALKFLADAIAADGYGPELGA
jgi:RNA polymerase sigma factor for flagellar operon FliA